MSLLKTLQDITKKSENEQKRNAIVKAEIERVTNILKTTANVVRAIADHLKKEGLKVELSTFYEMNLKHYNILVRW